MAKTTKSGTGKAKPAKTSGRPAPPAKRAARPKKHALKKLTAALFSPHVGTVFKTKCFAGVAADGSYSEGVEVDLTLISCEITQEKGKIELPKGPGVVRRKSFRLVFSGPDHFPFVHASYDLSHPKMGEVEGISMSPDLGPQHIKTFLTANFN